MSVLKDIVVDALQGKQVSFSSVTADSIFQVIVSAAKAMILGKKMATAMTKALHSDGFNLVQNNGEAAGQTVFHFHMHLIPRYEGDNAGIAAWKQGTLEDAVKEQIIESVTAELKA